MTGGRAPRKRAFMPATAWHKPKAEFGMQMSLRCFPPQATWHFSRLHAVGRQSSPLLSPVGGTVVVANVPCGIWREHTRKSSPHWFLLVHATIPLLAMLRRRF